MPNWCNNVVTLTGTTEQVDALVKYLEHVPEPGEQHGLLHYFKPEPEDEVGTKYWQEWGWYEWRNKNWGTKWELSIDSRSREGDSLTLAFDSAWAPPIGVYEAACDAGWGVKAAYWESGIGFAGEWHDGYDITVEPASMTEEEIAEEIPWCEEMFDLCTVVREWREQFPEDGPNKEGDDVR